MFRVGQKVIYPIHGLGIIESISNKNILGKKEKYYTLNLLTTGMKVMIPVKNVKMIGIRPIIAKKEVPKVLRVLKSNKRKRTLDWKLRYQENLDKIKSGSIYEIAEVIQTLHKRNKKKELSVVEKKLYDNAFDLIVNEIAVAKKFSREAAEKIVTKVIK